MELIYLDHCATTLIIPKVMTNMMGYFGFKFGNPSSSHRLEQEALAGVNTARMQVARAIGANHDEVILPAVAPRRIISLSSVRRWQAINEKIISSSLSLNIPLLLVRARV